MKFWDEGRSDGLHARAEIVSEGRFQPVSYTIEKCDLTIRSAGLMALYLSFGSLPEVASCSCLTESREESGPPSVCLCRRDLTFDRERRSTPPLNPFWEGRSRSFTLAYQGKFVWIVRLGSQDMLQISTEAQY